MIKFTDRVAGAVNKLRDIFPETPLQKNEFLSRKYGAEIYLKRKDLTPVRSYKIRGAFNFVATVCWAGLRRMPPLSVLRRVIMPRGLPLCAGTSGRRAVVFMPVTTPQQKIGKTRTFGGDYVEIRLIGDTFDQCYAAAQGLVAEGGGEIRNRRIILIISDGNFDFERLPEVKERALRFEGLKKYYIFRFPQRPGALRNFLELLGPEDDVARFEYLKKSARNFGSVLIAIETKHCENFLQLHERFAGAGWAYRDITDDRLLSDFII